MTFDSQFAANAAGLAGVLCLAVPALHVSKYALKAAELSRMRGQFTGPLKTRVQRTVDELRDIRDSWNRPKSFLLIAGTCLSLLSYGIPVAVHLFG